MWISDYFTRLWLWFQRLLTGRDRRPKVPRKKLQIQFDHTRAKFQEQVTILDQVLNRPGLMESTRKLGKQLLLDVHRFQELHLDRITKNRLETTPQQLLHPIDFSLWVLYQMYSYTEEIYHFVKTMEAVEL